MLKVWLTRFWQTKKKKVSSSSGGGYTQNTEGDDDPTPQEPTKEDFANYDAGMWEGYFAQIRNDPKLGKAAAEEELSYLIKIGAIPQKYVVYAAIGARGKLGH